MSRITHPRMFARVRALSKNGIGSVLAYRRRSIPDPAIDSGKIAVGFPEFSDSRADCASF